MKMKSKIVIGVVAAVVVIAIAGLLIFVLSGNNNEKTLDVDGVWKVATNVSEGVLSIPNNEYMVFGEDKVSDYRDGSTEPFVTSSYKVSGEVLELADISRTYHIAQTTEGLISLYTNDKTYITLVKAENEAVLNERFDPNSVSGRWNVVYRPTDKPIVNEYLIFNNGVLSNYRNNAETPTIEAEYEWVDNIVKAPALGIEMMGSRISSTQIVLIDIREGYIWLLNEAKD